MKTSLVKLAVAALAVCGVVASCEKSTKDQTQTDEELTVPAGAVDLGLDVYWAECNLGANTSQDYGDYYAWGEVEPEILGNGYWTDYKWAETEGSYASGSLKISLTKYNPSSDNGTVDNLTVLQEGDDAATVVLKVGKKLKGNWRMPTNAEWGKLKTGCNWEWDSVKGGYNVTSKTNGKSIFLPAAGARGDTNLGQAPWNGYYWSSSLKESEPTAAQCLNFYQNGVSQKSEHRCSAFSIRPVCDKK